MKDELGTVLLFLIYWFRLFGLCPISVYRSSDRFKPDSKLIVLWSVFLLVFFNTLFIIVVSRSSTFLYVEERFALFNDYLKVIATVISVNVSLLQSLQMRHYERKFWMQYIDLRSTRNPVVMSMSFRAQLREHWRFISKFVTIILVFIAFYLAFILLYRDIPHPLVMFWSMFTPYSVVVTMRNLQFIFYLDLIRMEVEYLEKDLDVLNEFIQWECTNRTFLHFDEFIRRRIVEKQKIYQGIFEMNETFQAACNWSMLFHLLRGYTRILVDCYYCIWSMSGTWNLMKDILLIPAILEIPMFLLTAKNCMTAAKYIQFRVHNLKHSADNVATSVQIQNFSLQLLHQKIKIDGLGIASMDGYMLTKAVGSITTYMIFFIQFMPKFKSKFD